jgi:hypothetical protein
VEQRREKVLEYARKAMAPRYVVEAILGPVIIFFGIVLFFPTVPSQVDFGVILAITLIFFALTRRDTVLAKVDIVTGLLEVEQQLCILQDTANKLLNQIKELERRKHGSQ